MTNKKSETNTLTLLQNIIKEDDRKFLLKLCKNVDKQDINEYIELHQFAECGLKKQTFYDLGKAHGIVNKKLHHISVCDLRQSIDPHDDSAFVKYGRLYPKSIFYIVSVNSITRMGLDTPAGPYFYYDDKIWEQLHTGYSVLFDVRKTHALLLNQRMFCVTVWFRK